MNKVKRIKVIQKNINGDLVLLYSRHYSGALMTQEAFNLIYRGMDLVDVETHKKAYIAPSTAADLYDEVLTREDVEEDPFLDVNLAVQSHKN